MRPKTLLVLTLLVLGLGVVLWLERDVPTTSERADRAKKVLTFESEEVEEVTLERGDRRVRLVRQPAPEGDTDDGVTPAREWRLAEPLEARADRFAVDGLLSAIANLEKERTLEEGGDRSEHGLEPPADRITVVLPSGPRTLELGAELPASSSRMAAIAGEAALYVVPSSLDVQLDKAAGDWRDKQLFTGTRNDIERLRIEGGAEPLLLARRGEEAFWIEAPLADRADPDFVNRLLGDLTGLRAEEFVDDPPSLAELGLDPPAASLEVVLAGEEDPFRVEWGAAVEGGERSYARVDGQLVELAGRFAESLERTAADWRSRAWASLRSYEVDRVEAADGEGELTLTKVDGDWKRGEDTLSFSVVSDLLYAITGARAEKLADGPPATELGAPVRTFLLASGEGTEERLSVYAANYEGVPVRSEGRDVTLVLPANAGEEIANKLAAVRSARPEGEEGDDEGFDDQTGSGIDEEPDEAGKEPSGS